MNKMVGRQVKVILLDDPYLGRVGNVVKSFKYGVHVIFKDGTTRLYDFGHVVFVN